MEPEIDIYKKMRNESLFRQSAVQIVAMKKLSKSQFKSHCANWSEKTSNA